MWPFRKRAKPLPIPEFAERFPPIDIKPLEPKDPAYVVEQSEMTQTGMWRLFPWKKPKE